MTIQEQVEMWNKFIADNEKYAVFLNVYEVGKLDYTLHIDEPFELEGSVVYSPCNQQEYVKNVKGRQHADLFDNLILYSLARLDPLRVDRGE